MKKLLCLIIALCLALSIGGAALAADEVSGEYTCFAVSQDGFLADPADLGLTSTLTLDEDGTGLLTLNGEEVPLESWSEADGVLTVTSADGGSSTAEILDDGVVVLDLYGGSLLLVYYAKEGTDVSGYDIMTMEEIEAAYLAGYNSLMYAVCEQIIETDSLHLDYDMHSDYQDSLMCYDVHIADGVYYSSDTTYVNDLSNTKVTFIQDGKVYNLYPDKMTGNYVTDMISGIDVRMMDDVFNLLFTYGQELDYTEETVELEEEDENGETVVNTYTAVIYPSTEYQPEHTFYFDEDGQLAYILEGEPVIDVGVDIGESFYTIYLIDDAVDTSLFDVSGYEISE